MLLTDPWLAQAWDEAARINSRLYAAIHMLHEQAHGDDVPYRSCGKNPCAYLPLDLRGPAPRVLP